jgi:hypothetical protein
VLETRAFVRCNNKMGGDFTVKYYLICPKKVPIYFSMAVLRSVLGILCSWLFVHLRQSLANVLSCRIYHASWCFVVIKGLTSDSQLPGKSENSAQHRPTSPQPIADSCNWLNTWCVSVVQKEAFKFNR